PVLYGMIDPFAETNQIRISRVFFGANGINNSLLSNDSISFSSVDVILELTDLNYIYYSMELEAWLIEKDSGLFSNEPYIAYELSAIPMNRFFSSVSQEGFTHLKLQVVSDDLKEPAVVIEKVFKQPKIIQPSRYETQLRLYSTSKRSTLIWDPPEDAGYHEVSFEVCYNELVDGIVISKMIQWSLTSPILSLDNTKQMVIDGDRFMRRISIKLSGQHSQNIKKLTSVTLEVLSGSESAKDYFKSYSIAADHNGQPISNVINGLGVIGVYTKASMTDLELTARALDSLVSGQITRHLRFVKYDIGGVGGEV
ncbi:MAG: DUF4249 family protein, partial [Bacteroidota bacterium]|nr:DUF4249 family protein [Bacteroidota bacterium]